MTTENIKQVIAESNGKFFSVVYESKNGERNNYVVRTGVVKHLKGGKNYCPENAVTLYAVTKNGMRDFAGYKTMYLDKLTLKN
jgi:hypothetical protein